MSDEERYIRCPASYEPLEYEVYEIEGVEKTHKLSANDMMRIQAHEPYRLEYLDKMNKIILENKDG